MSLSMHISRKGRREGENGLAPSSPVTRVAHLRPFLLLFIIFFWGGGGGWRRGRLGEQGLLLAMRKRRIFASQFNEAPYCCAAICISVIYRCLLEKLLPSEFLEVFFFLIALCSLLSLWRPRLQCNHAEKQRKMTIFKLHGGCCYNNLIICHECPLTELFCYSYLLRLRKNNKVG